MVSKMPPEFILLKPGRNPDVQETKRKVGMSRQIKYDSGRNFITAKTNTQTNKNKCETHLTL